MAKDRQTYLDTAGGLLLIYMIVYHCAQHAQIGDAFIRYTLLLSFFMQWFFFKAGMFFRPVTFKENLSKSVKRLLVPWAIWNIIGMFVYIIEMRLSGQAIDLRFLLTQLRATVLSGTTRGNLALWFLTSLFAVRLLYGALHRSRLLWLWVLMFAAVPFVMRYGVANIVPYRVLINIPRYVTNVSMGLFFYALGYRLRHYNPSVCVLLVLIVSYAVSMYVDPTYVFFFENRYMMGTYALAPIFAIVGIIWLNGLCRRLGNYPNLLSRVGADTMPYYCMHWVILELVSVVYLILGRVPGLSEPDIYMFIAMVGANVVLLPLLTWLLRKTRIKYIFG